MPNDHILKRYDNELRQLTATVAKMGGLAEAQLASAIAAVAGRDSELAARVVEGDDQVDLLETEIDAMVMRMLALRQPMADDLRDIMSARRVAAELERIADYASNVAKRSIVLGQMPALKLAQTIVRMGAVTQAMIKDVLDAYAAGDADKALAVWQRDSEVDDIHNNLFRVLLTYMMEDPRAISTCTHLLFMAKNIERIGDHITNIAEMIYYSVRGEPMKRVRVKSDVTSLTAAPGPSRESH